MKIHLHTYIILRDDDQAYLLYRHLSDGKAEPIETLIWSDWDIYPFTMPTLSYGMRMSSQVVSDGADGYTYALEPIPVEDLMQDAKRQLTDAVQRHLDETAQGRGYDGILSLCSYIASPNPPFKEEAEAGLAWRDAVWLKCYQVMADVIGGVRQIPSEEELLAELPTIGW